VLIQKPGRPWSVFRLTACCALVLSLAACGSNSDPLQGAGAPVQPQLSAKSSAPAVPSTSPTPTPTPVAQIPKAATAHTDDGAVAFVKYYFDTLVNAAYQTGNVQPMALASDPNCVICRATIGDAAYFTVTGTRAQGGTVSVASLTVSSSGDNLVSVMLSYSSDKLSEINVDGSTAYTTPAVGGSPLEAQVLWNAPTKGWRMRQIVNNPTSPTATPTP
jgi:uncharacterized protein DUF6318